MDLSLKWRIHNLSGWSVPFFTGDVSFSKGLSLQWFRGQNASFDRWWLVIAREHLCPPNAGNWAWLDIQMLECSSTIIDVDNCEIGDSTTPFIETSPMFHPSFPCMSIGGKLATQLIMMNPLKHFISYPSTVEGVLYTTVITTPHYLIDHDV